MQQITGDMKVADVIRRWPSTAQIFRSKGCHDADVGWAARVMTVRNAARKAGVDLASLLAELNTTASREHTR
jgi:iron-sulfur cluster repair protein YtfE (RIC family)